VANPDGDLTAGHDILDFGSWDAEWQYCGPEEDWRFHLWLDRPDIKLSDGALGRYRAWFEEQSRPGARFPMWNRRDEQRHPE